MSRKDDFDLQQFLPYLLNQAAEEASLAFQQAYKAQYGMLRTEWRVLFHLGMFAPMTARDIGQRAKIHKTKISRAVARLSERRYLTRTRRAEDRREEVLSLTPAGRAAYLDLRRIAQEYDTRLAARLAPGDAGKLREMLRILAGLEGEA